MGILHSLLFLDVVQTAKTDLPLIDAAQDTFCNNQGIMKCGKMLYSEATVRHPERVEFEYHRNDLPYRGFSMVVYRTASGDLLNFSTRKSRSDIVFNAIIDSAVMTYDSPVRAPEPTAWKAQPLGHKWSGPMNLGVTPSITPTHRPTPLPLSVWTPQAILEGGTFADYWAEYRDPDEGYGFAYPADWILRGRPDTEDVDMMMIRDNNLTSSGSDDILRICVQIDEITGEDPSLPLDQSAQSFFARPQRFPGEDRSS